MISEEQFDKLRSENELLQLQLDDVNMMIRIREEELELLRSTAREAAEMHSLLQNNLTEIDQVQRKLSDSEHQNSGNEKRLEEMEEELFQSIREQMQYAETLRSFNSMEANLLDTSAELHEASAVYKKLGALQTTLAQTKSELEIALMEIASLKEDLREANELNDLLKKKRLNEK